MLVDRRTKRAEGGCGCADPLDCGCPCAGGSQCEGGISCRDSRERSGQRGSVTKRDEHEGGLRASPWRPVVQNPCGTGNRAVRAEELILNLPPLAIGEVQFDPSPDTARGEFTYPSSRIAPPTGFPIVIIAHGFIMLRDSIDPVLSCRLNRTGWPAASQPESYKGYRYLADQLASHGFAVLSLDLRHVNLWHWATRMANPDRLRTVSDDYFLRARHILRVLVALWLGRGPVDIDRRKVALIGHSNGGAGVRLAQDINERHLGRMFGVQAVVGLEANQSESFEGSEWTEGTTIDMGGADFLNFVADCDVQFGKPLARWVESSSDTPGITLIRGRRFHHQLFNRVWTDLMDDELDGTCQPIDSCTLFEPGRTGELTAGRLLPLSSDHWDRRRQERIVKCYTTALLLSRFLGLDGFYSYLERKRPLPPGLTGAYIRTVEHWPDPDLVQANFAP